MKQDLSVLVAGLVLFLRHPESYKIFLRCRGTGAQQLLDLLQDVSTSDGLVNFDSNRMNSYSISTSFQLLSR
jgi:hypothetical protein